MRSAARLSATTWSPRSKASTSGRGAVEEAQAGPELGAQRDQPAHECEQRRRVAALAGDVALGGVDEREPRLAGREAAGGGPVPLHGMAVAVAPRAVVGRVVAGSVGHPDLVALVDEGEPGQRQQQHRRGAHVGVRRRGWAGG